MLRCAGDDQLGTVVIGIDTPGPTGVLFDATIIISDCIISNNSGIGTVLLLFQEVTGMCCGNASLCCRICSVRCHWIFRLFCERDCHNRVSHCIHWYIQLSQYVFVMKPAVCFPLVSSVLSHFDINLLHCRCWGCVSVSGFIGHKCKRVIHRLHG